LPRLDGTKSQKPFHKKVRREITITLMSDEQVFTSMADF
jgi:hypothetical protein